MWWRRRPRLAATAMVALLILACGLGLGDHRDRPAASLLPVDAPAITKAEELLALEARLAALRPQGVFLTVDTIGNRLRVHRGGEILREAVCSTGTGWVLEDPRTDRRWTFDTPRGLRTVLAKRRDPVWTRPDWSFIEEGAELPVRWSERVDHGVLGDWALDLGDGYMIHGTLLQRFLGRSVTHGCIRLGDADLEYVARTTPLHAPVFLY